MKLQGRVWKLGDHVDTDLIIPARFLNVSDKEELAKNCFADHRPDFAREVVSGDVIVAGINFGCGSSREHAPWAIKAAGVSLVVAGSFARIFYRNAFNIGLPILESEDAPGLFGEKDQILADLTTGELTNPNTGRSIFAKPIPDFMRRIVEAGGLVDYVKEKKSFSS
jgi:3-isopropylmalate/(R)-2-methylmalate dehydratase small subunit